MKKMINLLGFEINETEYDKYRTHENSPYIDVDKLIKHNCIITECVDAHTVQDRFDDTTMVLRTIKNMMWYQAKVALEKKGYDEEKAIYGGFQASNLNFYHVRGEECFVLKVTWENWETRVDAHVKAFITGETYVTVLQPVKK